ncbi:MAG TPA: CAP domain-containing protein [Steroidobacteraceae bacterium]|nr:CAP domain-containing protein [Steroidobacteraceae bacterium]
MQRQYRARPGLTLGVLLLVMSAGGLASKVARADVPGVLRWARSQGCPAASRADTPLPPLHEDARLDRIAAELVRGATLAHAMTHGAYRATHSAEIRITGSLDEAVVSRVLIGEHCATLSDPRLQDWGLARASGTLLIVLAQPLGVPEERDAAAIDHSVLESVNAARAAGHTCGGRYYPPAPPLSINALLNGAALEYSRSMARSGHFDHIGLDGSTPHTRVQATGYPIALVGENIAAGALTADEAVRGWLASAGHCRNIMNPRFRDTGIGFAVNTARHLAVYWTQEFAAPARSH